MPDEERKRNPHCSNCGDTRGGPVGHEISECTYVRPVVELPPTGQTKINLQRLGRQIT